MNEFDGRKLDHKTLEELRIQAVKRVENGESPEAVIKSLGFSRARIYDWLARYRKHGIDGLRSRLATGRPPRLNDRQIQQVYQLMVDNDPRQLHFEFSLWTWTMVQDLIQQEFNVHLSEVSVGRLLAKIGLSPQRPVRREGQNNETLVMDWMTKDFPAIKKMAKKEQATIYFGNETSIRSVYHSSKTAVSRGEDSVMTSTGSHSKTNLISAISTKGVLRFMATETMIKSDFFFEFLHRLIDKAPHPVYLIIDRHSTHRSKKIREFIASAEDRLKILYLPPRSPEFNPDELVWNYFKKQYNQAPNS
ncbi:MAG: IS630 family transposase [Desulfocapsaceae bacterium]|nr:IS630 family transposase [Desulfocapsaceae bacterium]